MAFQLDTLRTTDGPLTNIIEVSKYFSAVTLPQFGVGSAAKLNNHRNMSATLQRLLRTADECVPATNKESLIVELEEACLKWKEVLTSRRSSSSLHTTLIGFAYALTGR